MNAVTVVGKFVMEKKDGTIVPVRGQIKFIPSRLWVDHQEQSWATLSDDLALDDEGGFSTTLTPTHGHDNSPWFYTVVCPIGKWTIKIEENENPVQIRKLLPSQFSG